MSLKKLLVEDSAHWAVQLFRYAIVGGIAFCVDFGLLWALTETVGCHYVVAGTISFIAGLATNYLLSVAWVFRHSSVNNRKLEFLLFAMVGVIGLALNAAILYLLTDWLAVHYLLSKLVSTAIVFLWNFVGRRTLMSHKFIHDSKCKTTTTSGAGR